MLYGNRLARLISVVNAVALTAVTLYFLTIPTLLIVRTLRDPGMRNGEIPRFAWRLHQYLTPRYERWARERIASGAAGKVHYLDVPATEWPLFGSVFYLWATEHLQEAWKADPGLSQVAPAVYARDTIEACKDVLVDPVHHTWVVTHWGDDYMHEQNVFFRSLVIAGLTSYERLTGSGAYLPLLRDQIDTLSQELDASPYGVLYDYPGECYPIDVFAAVAWIREADQVTGTDHSAFVERQRRAFTGDRLDSYGLIPWLVDPRSGEQFEPSRGIVNSHILIFAPDIYPDLAKTWYDLYEKHFWQETWYAAGYREFYRDRSYSEWTFDVDSGPVIDGFSPSANAFGIAMARANGRMDQAYTLTAQVLAVSYPMPDGSLPGARLLSDPRNAPYLGEVGLLWQLTEKPREGMSLVKGGHLPGAVKIGLAIGFGLSFLIYLFVFLRQRQTHRRIGKGRYRGIGIQFTLWAILMGVTALIVLGSGSALLGIPGILVAQVFPFLFKREEQVETAG